MINIRSTYAKAPADKSDIYNLREGLARGKLYIGILILGCAQLDIGKTCYTNQPTK